MLCPETICEMNQKGENTEANLSVSLTLIPEILQRTFFGLGMIVGTVLPEFWSKKVLEQNLLNRAGQHRQPLV